MVSYFLLTRGVAVVRCLKADKMKDKEDIILDYLQKTNRPYSAIDIFNNLKEKIPKTLVVKCLNSMVENEVITGKLYGKQWVYVARQDLVECPTQEQISKMDDRIDELKESISCINSTVLFILIF